MARLTSSSILRSQSKTAGLLAAGFSFNLRALPTRRSLGKRRARLALGAFLSFLAGLRLIGFLDLGIWCYLIRNLFGQFGVFLRELFHGGFVLGLLGRSQLTAQFQHALAGQEFLEFGSGFGLV